MIRGIVPLVKGKASESVCARRAIGLYVVGSCIGGTAIAAFAWLTETPLRTLAPVWLKECCIALVVALCIARDIRGHGFLGRASQVPAGWYQRFGLQNAYFRYGVVLGSAVATYVPIGVVYVVVVAIGLMSPGWAMAAGCSLGLGRGISLALGTQAAGIERVMVKMFSSWKPATRIASVTMSLGIATLLDQYLRA